MNKPIFNKIAELFDKKFIKIEDSTISFQIQDGPIKELGLNGCQIDEIGKVWLEIIKGFNGKFPCIENEQTIAHIQIALDYQLKRTQGRIKRNVEGTNNL